MTLCCRCFARSSFHVSLSFPIAVPPCDHVSLPIPPYLTVSIDSFPATFPRDSSSSLFLYPFNPQLSSAGSLSFSLPVSPSFLLYCRCSLLLFGFPSPSMFNLESVSPRVRTRAFVELISHRMCRQLSIVSIGLSVSRSTLECVALCFSSRSPCRLVQRRPIRAHNHSFLRCPRPSPPHICVRHRIASALLFFLLLVSSHCH